jgi:Lrp/AsnC family transcriptional regulator for asnA, asnC and gidA
MTPKEKINDIDIAILKILQEDSRTSYREIKEKLGVSIGTIHNHISKMKETGVIKAFSVILDDEKLGYSLTGTFQLRLKNKTDKSIEQFIIDLSTEAPICSFYQISGEFSFLLICKFQTLKDYGLYIDRLNRDLNIKDMISNIIIKKYVSSLNIRLGVDN